MIRHGCAALTKSDCTTGAASAFFSWLQLDDFMRIMKKANVGL
jgi:hypothetical protein